MAEFKTPLKARPFKDERDPLVIPPSPFLKQLGYGTGVKVMQLLRSPREGQIRSPWALKMINKRVKPNKVYGDRIHNEAEILAKLSHPNVVGFRVYNKKQDVLGMEACDISIGDMIEQKMEKGDNEPFSPNQILRMAIDIGKALDYLHTKVYIIHGDIKSHNILVNGDFEICKLCDFGVTLPLDKQGLLDAKKAGNSRYYGTEPWSAPEVINGGQISSKTDIFPFGIVLWEMMTLMQPHSNAYEDLSNAGDDSSLDLSNDDGDFNFETYGTRPALPDSVCAVTYGEPLALFYCCTEQLPESRPTAHHIVLCAEDMMRSNNI